MRKTTLTCIAIAFLMACDRQPTVKPNSSSRPTIAVDAREPVFYLAGAGTTNASEEAAAAFSVQTGVPVTFSPGPSNLHASQILAGAPADVFLSANKRWADAVIEAGLAVDSKRLFSNALVIVVPHGNPANIHGPGDLLRNDVKRLALAGENVPAGIYAAQALRATGIYDALLQQGKVMRAEDVRFTLAYADRGEVDAAIIYATDARVAEHAEIAYAFDDASHEPIVFTAVLLKTNKPDDAARRFYEFLQSPEAMAIFAKHGFTAAAPPTTTRP